MDPEACLVGVEDELNETDVAVDLDDVLYRLCQYARWRSKGGYEPPDGDRRAVLLLGRYESRRKVFP
jgi:hypothetical protein